MKAVDVVVWGATGLTGKRVCLQLAQQYQDKVKWAIAGRSREKLTTLRQELCQIHDSCKDVPLVVADISDRPSIDAMVQQAEVVVACAGPFSQYSDVVLESCVAQGSHFLDVTGHPNLILSFTNGVEPVGEVGWVRSVMDRFHAEAERKGVKVVNCCGFDSVPADVGTFFLVNHVKKRYGRGVSRVLGCYSVKTKGGVMVSGGTLATMLQIMSSDASERKLLDDLYLLNPPDKRPQSGGVPDQYWVKYDEEFGFWTSPFLMQSPNKRVVQRSTALQPTPYGRDFTYAECQKENSWMGAFVSVIQLFFIGFTLLFSPLRGLLFKLGTLPRPGEGPSIEDEEQAKWSVTFYGSVEPEEANAGSQPLTVTTRISDSFGAYTTTARMVLECAMCQVLEQNRLKDLNLPEGGVLTPSLAFGEVLVQRLHAIGIECEVLQDN